MTLTASVGGYDAGNKRVWPGSASPALDEFTFWSGNQKWATYSMAVSGSTIYFTLAGTNVYFAGRLIAKGTYNSGGADDKVALASIATDRLGSVANNGVNKFYPYGQERTATANDKEKFTGYFRDAATGLDYAGQRYHNPGQGRFMTPDPFGGSAKLSDPGSWNRYAYVSGDPVNSTDPSGLCLGYGSDFDGSCNANAIGAFGDPYFGGCYIDGVLSDCGIMYSVLGAGAAAVCPNNFCEGFQTQGGGATYVQFQSSVDGSQSYVGLTDTIVNPTPAEDAARQVTQAYTLACQFATNSCEEPQTVGVRLEGNEYNVQLPNNPLNVSSASEAGIRDPITYVHDNNDSYYIGSVPVMFGIDVPHVVSLPNGIEAHSDHFGPFNPLHWVLDWLPSLVVNPHPGLPSTWICAVNGCMLMP